MKNVLVVICGILTFITLGSIAFKQKHKEEPVVIRNSNPILAPQIIEKLPEPKPKLDIVNKKFQGKWITVKGKFLEGIMTCNVNSVDQKSWTGTFYGTWQGVDFSYDVVWTGPKENLIGTATVDGVPYRWTGSISPEGRFKGEFKSPRYDGSFDLNAI